MPAFAGVTAFLLWQRNRTTRPPQWDSRVIDTNYATTSAVAVAGTANVLLEFNLGACSLEVFLHLLGIGLRHCFLHGLRCAFNEVLGFFQAEGRASTNGLNDADLVVASRR